MGRGIITVSQALFERQEIKDQDGNVIAESDEPIKQPQSLAEWHALLMLPEGFRLLEAKSDQMYPYWHVIVEHEDIPTIEGKLLEVSPIYCVEQKGETRTHYLDRIEIGRYGSNEWKTIWQRSK